MGTGQDHRRPFRLRQSTGSGGPESQTPKGRGPSGVLAPPAPLSPGPAKPGTSPLYSWRHLPGRGASERTQSPPSERLAPAAKQRPPPREAPGSLGTRGKAGSRVGEEPTLRARAAPPPAPSASGPTREGARGTDQARGEGWAPAAAPEGRDRAASSDHPSCFHSFNPQAGRKACAAHSPASGTHPLQRASSSAPGSRQPAGWRACEPAGAQAQTLTDPARGAWRDALDAARVRSREAVAAARLLPKTAESQVTPSKYSWHQPGRCRVIHHTCRKALGLP